MIDLDDQSHDKHYQDNKETIQEAGALLQDRTVPKPPHKEKAPFITNVQNVSPVKTSRKGFSCFNVTLQTESYKLDGVSFDNSMQNILSKTEETQKPIKVSHYGLKRPLNEENLDSVVINKRSKIDYVNSCTFEFQKIQESKTVKITETQSLPEHSIVTVIGKICNQSEIETVNLSNSTIEKLECKIRNESNCIGITVWGKDIQKNRKQNNILFRM